MVANRPFLRGGAPGRRRMRAASLSDAAGATWLAVLAPTKTTLVHDWATSTKDDRHRRKTCRTLVVCTTPRTTHSTSARAHTGLPRTAQVLMVLVLGGVLSLGALASGSSRTCPYPGLVPLVCPAPISTGFDEEDDEAATVGNLPLDSPSPPTSNSLRFSPQTSSLRILCSGRSR